MNDFNITAFANNLRQKNWGEVWRIIRQEMLIHKGESIKALPDADKNRLKELLSNALLSTESEKETIVLQLKDDLNKAIQNWFI